MPRLKPDTQRRRRENILDAAEICFARSGFHRTSMQDICKEARVSPGALYLYFDSKEALIAGISERDRTEFLGHFEMLSRSSDFVGALEELAHHYFADEPPHRRLMCIEIGLEATRNPIVGEIYRSVDMMVQDSFRELFRRLIAKGAINPKLEPEALAGAFMTIGDGLFWRRAVDPNFDPSIMIPAAMTLVQALLNPVDPASAVDATAGRSPVEMSR